MQPRMQPRSVLFYSSCSIWHSVNLKHWNIQCGSKCSLCGYSQLTTAHVLGGCSVALSQGNFTYRHDRILHCLATEILKHFVGPSVVSVYADLPDMWASDCPQSTISPSLLITSYRPELVIYNQETNSIVTLELTCPLDSAFGCWQSLRHIRIECSRTLLTTVISFPQKLY